MAPPPNRRPGFSRRAQYSLFVGYLLSIVGLFVGLLLVVTAHFDPSGHAAVRSLLGDVAAPVSSGGRAVVRVAEAAPTGIAAYINAGNKNRALNEELKADRSMLTAGQNAALENSRLKGLLRLASSEKQPVIAVRLISSTGSSSRRYAMIDKGTLHHIAVGQPVRSTEGLVGQVVQTGLISSQILLISDAGNVVPVKRVSDGAVGLANGTGDGSVIIHALTAGNNPFRAGDVFVTSGAGGVYQPGIPVARAVSVDRDGAVATLFADTAALDFGLVEPVYMAPLTAPIQINTKKVKHKVADE